MSVSCEVLNERLLAKGALTCCVRLHFDLKLIRKFFNIQI